jgi:LEA14-like dessication related protein
LTDEYDDISEQETDVNDDERTKHLSGKKKLIKILVFIIIIIVIIGLISHLVLMYLAAESLEITDKRITRVRPLSTAFDEYEVTFKITLKNPTSTAVEIEKLTYNAYLEDEFIGSGEKTDFSIEPGSREYTFKLQFNIFDLTSSVRELFILQQATLIIKGSVTAPVKFFGLLKVSEISLDYTMEKDVTG